MHPIVVYTLAFCLSEVLSVELVLFGEERAKRQALIYPGERDEYSQQWPGGLVSYWFDDDKFDPRAKEAVLLAMEKISNYTCIDFTTSPADVMIRMFTKYTGDCNAEITRTRPNQDFVFDNRCYSVGQAVHELVHSLGFIHAHQRRDRDRYLNLNMSRYWSETDLMQYGIYRRQKIYVPYDYGSIMQYWADPDEFTSKNPEYQRTMGSEIVSYYDFLMINRFYNCRCSQKATVTCKNFGYPNPRNCSKCNCPWGYGGDDCGQRADPGVTLEAAGDWKPLNVSVDAGYRVLNGEKVRHVDFTYYFLWITAPANKTIEVNVEKFSNVTCEHGCRWAGFEVKTLKNPRLTSPRQCCQESLKVYKSDNNPTTVMFFNTQGIAEFNLSYRYVDK